MMKIAAHNSATGGAGRGFLSFLVAPFSKCQSKTIKEQYEAGARYFDIRYKYSTKRGCYVCAHGLWESKKCLYDVLEEIHWLGDCYVMLTCESGKPMDERTQDIYINTFRRIKFTSFNVKHHEWEIVYSIKPLPHINAYKILDWQTWHTLIPIPWLWEKVYYNKPAFNEDTFTVVDFL